MTEMIDIRGYEGRYAVTHDGRVWSYRNRIFLKTHEDGSGYHFAALYDGKGGRSQPKVHVLVAQEWIDNPLNLPVVNHKNGMKSDNRVKNLEWVTRSENILHAFETGLSNQKGSANAYSKLCDADVAQIRFLVSEGAMQKDVAAQFDISKSTVSTIVSGKTWPHLPIGAA